MDRSERRDELARLLRRGAHHSVDALCVAVSASRRTVLRDLSALRERGYSIETQGGPGGGVRMDPDTVMLSGQLGTEEVVALILSVALLRAASWMPFAKGAERALRKIEGALPATRVRDLRRLLKRVLVGAPASAENRDAVGSVAPELLPAFERAFGSLLGLAFDYVDREGRASQRQVEPQALLVRAPLWYVIAWDPGRAGLRLFRMDRIRSPRVVEGNPFELRSLDLIAGVCPDVRQGRSA